MTEQSQNWNKTMYDDNLKLFVCFLDLQFRPRFLCTFYMFGMAIGVVEFSREGYKIRKDFA